MCGVREEVPSSVDQALSQPETSAGLLASPSLTLSQRCFPAEVSLASVGGVTCSLFAFPSVRYRVNVLVAQ